VAVKALGGDSDISVCIRGEHCEMELFVIYLIHDSKGPRASKVLQELQATETTKLRTKLTVIVRAYPVPDPAMDGKIKL
jgi:hypothetical protein